MSADPGRRRLDPAALDIEEIAFALSDNGLDEQQWFIDPATGEVLLWTYDLGFGDGPVDLDDLDLVAIDPLPDVRLVRGHGRLRGIHRR